MHALYGGIVNGADSRLQTLRAMGIDVWVRRDAGATAGLQDPAQAERRDEVPVAEMDWRALRATVAACTGCELHRTRTQTVFGVGDTGARLMVIGEAPGADEDRQGEPFVGRAGRLLNQMLRAIGLERGQVFIANVLKCRPPNNRDPQAEEVLRCRGYLERQIQLIAPAVVLALGRIAAQHLLDTTLPLGRLRGQVHALPGTGQPPVLATYHPAYLLRSPQDKRKTWADLCLVRSLLEGAEGSSR